MNYVVYDTKRSVFKSGVNSYMEVNLQDAENHAVDLTGATVKALIASTDKLLLEQEAEITDASTGGVAFVMIKENSLPAGTYDMEFEVTYPDGTTEIFPDRAYLRIRVIKGLRQKENTFVVTTDLTRMLGTVSQVTEGVNELTVKTDWIDVREHGARGGGLGDDAPGIIAALALAQTLRRKRVEIPDGLYNIGQTLVVPRRVHLVMGKDTVLRPIKDINVLQLKPEAFLQGGVVDTRRFTGRTYTDFTKACIFLDGSDTFSLYNELHRIQDIMLLGEDHYYTDQAWTGTAIHFYSGKGSGGVPQYISFVQGNNVAAFNFDRGIYFEVDETIKDESEWACVTGCTFDNVAMMNCKRAIELEGEGSVPRDVGGNQFKNLQIQIEPTSDFAIYCEGSYNTFEGLFWDLHKNPNPSFRFSKGAKFNKIICAHGYEQPQHFLDDGWFNTVSSVTNHVPDKLTLAYPLSTPFKPNMLGNQDDYMVRGDLRGYTIMQKSTHTLKNNYLPLSELLTMEMEQGHMWDATQATYENPIVLEVDLAADPIWYAAFMGLTSAWNKAPKGVKVEAYDALTNEWTWCHEVDKNSSYPFVVAAPWVGISKCTKLRYSFWGTNDPAGKEVQVSRLFAMSSKDPGKAWMPLSGGRMTGKLYTDGGLVLEKRTSDPTDAEIGQAWYRTDSVNSPARIKTADGVKALMIQAIPNEYLNIAAAVKNGTTAVIQENTADYIRVTSKNNSDGLIIPLINMTLGKTYTVNIDAEILNNVDDLLQIRLYNRTKAAYITTNLAKSTVTKNVKQNFNKNFTLDAATYTQGDIVELWIVQSWMNSTHDTFEFKVYKNTLSVI